MEAGAATDAGAGDVVNNNDSAGDQGATDQGAVDGPLSDACGIPASCSVEFKYPKGSESKVDLHGDFNGWKSGQAMAASGSWWKTSLTLTHNKKVLYKFVLDGKTWVTDPNNPKKESDGYGGFNSVLNVACPSNCADSGTVTPDSGSAPDSGSTPGAFDWRDGVMYFVLLDRFKDGNPSNNTPESGVKTPANWQGGDLQGLLDQLTAGYFSGLGVNVIWISSPVDAPAGKYIGVDKEYYTGYHGYWPTELTKVEEHLGDLKLLQKVVSEAHKRGIKVVMDYVMNHVHKNSSTYKSNASWFWDLNYYGKTCVCGQGCSWDVSPENKRCWFMDYLPDFDFTKSAPRSFSVNNAIKWIQDTGVDGYRLDAVKHIEMSWLTDLRSQINSKIIKSGQRFYLVGETFTYSKSGLKPYIDPKTKLDGQFDFPLRKELVKVILMRQGTFKDLDSFLNSNDGYYGSGAIMGNFLGNHDLPRSIHLAEDTPGFGEMDSGKNKAWYNTPSQPGYDKPYQRLAVAFTALMTLPGVPLIYYGDEIGLAGGGDPDNRRFMQWSGYNSHQSTLKAHLAKLGQIRKTFACLRRGTRKEHWKSNDVYAYSMTLGAEQLVVALNRSDSSKTITPTLKKSSYTDLLSGKSVSAASITIPARSSLVLQ